MPRRQTQLRGPKDRVSQNKTTKRKAGKGLDALAIAEAEYPINPRIRRSRLGDDDEFSKRKRDDADGPDSKRRRTGDEDSSDNGDSDGDGREWKIGEVDSDNDEELDSDEALGSSDEELFEGFTFRGSSSTKSKPKQEKEKKSRQINLSEDADESDEDMNEDEEDDDEEDDDLGEDAVDLLTAWDMNTAAEEEEARKTAAKAKKAATDDYDEESGSQDEEEDSDDESSDDDDNALSASDDDADAVNEHGLSRLQDFVNSMETDATSKPARKTGSAQEQSKPTEYGLISSKKLTVADLLPSISDSRLKNSLKHVDAAIDHKQSAGIPGKLDAPAPKRQQDRMEREAAYEKSKETMDRWLETVKANRRAEHLVFPLPNPDAQQVHKLDAPKPQNDLESTIQNILVESGLANAQGKSNEDEVKEFEELEGRKLPIEEIRARRAELRKRRELLFREEVRAKRIKKIKSKSYRRVHRKERERLEQQERQALIDAGVDLEEEEKEKMERQRAEARMGSKHKDSKWAKSLRQTGRTAWDEEARLGAADLALKEEELRKRIEGKRVSHGEEDYLESSSESEDEDPWQEHDSDVEKEKIHKKLAALEGGDDEAEYKGPHAKLLSMKFMQNADAARKEQNNAEIRRLNRELQGDEESQSEAESEVGRRKFGQSKSEKPERKPEPIRKNEFEEPPDSDDDAVGEPKAVEATQATSKPKSSARPANKNDAPARLSGNTSKRQETVSEVEENPWLVQTNRTNRKPVVNATDQSVDISFDDAPAPASKSSSVSKGQKPKAPAAKKLQIAEDDGSDDEEKVPVLLKNHDLVKRAFAGDEVVQEFEQEKLDTIEDEGDKVVDNTLPGWGSWTGDGVSKKQQKRQKRHLTTIEGVKPEQRKDAKLSKVIINEKRQKKVS